MELKARKFRKTAFGVTEYTTNNSSFVEESARLCEESESDMESADLSIDERRKRFVISQPVRNIKIAQKFQKARYKLRGVYLWSKMLREIKQYGTSTHLYDENYNIRRNLTDILKKKQRIIRVADTTTMVHRCMFHPESRGRMGWNLWIAVLLLYTFTYMPYLITFEDLHTDNFWFWFEAFVDACFICDIGVILNTAYYDAHQQLVTNRKKIFLNYLTGMLIIDLVTVFPFYVFDDSRENRLFRVFRIARLFKIFRASKCVSLMKSLRKSEKVNTVVRFFKLTKGLIRLLSFMIVVLILSHFAACLWYYIARFNDFDYDTWVFRYEMLNDTKARLYLTSLYWAFTTLTTVGYGDIAAFSNDEITFSLLWMLFGVGIYSFVIGSLTSVLSNYDAR